MSITTKISDILGINARNLLYVSRFNSSAAKRFADDKFFTKQFLASRGIGTARLFRRVCSYAELNELDLATVPPSFVIKPNHGYGGEGIIVVERREGNSLMTVAGERMSHQQFLAHVGSILDGRYAISGLRDTAIFEERLIPHTCFTATGACGLPDVRVIVFNSVPVMAMLRLPTQASHGKANLHLGALGLGLDLATGRVTHIMQNNRYATRFPSGLPCTDFTVPEWDEILLTAAQIQKYTKIGYLAVDFAVTTTGVKVLEVNARAGLSIQLINRAPLKRRLEKVADLTIRTPEEGVEFAKKLFGVHRPMIRETPIRPVLGLFESVTLVTPMGPRLLTAKINPHAAKNLMSHRVGYAGVLDCIIQGQRLRTSFQAATLPPTIDMVLGASTLKDFLIDPAVTQQLVTPGSIYDRGREAMLLPIDRALAALDRKIKLLSYVRPLNLTEARAEFLVRPTVNPRFVYRTREMVPALRQELAKLPREIAHPLGALYVAKYSEIAKKIDLIAAVGSSDFSACSVALFGGVSAAELRAARQVLATPLVPDTSAPVSLEESVAFFRAGLQRVGLTQWEVVVSDTSVARVQVTKTRKLLLSQQAVFTKHQLASVFAHEIETHAFRYENGLRQPYQIFSRGTADYLGTEEGLAIYNQRQLQAPLGTRARGPEYAVFAIAKAAKCSFVQLFAELMETFPLTPEDAWEICAKVKRGLSDTAQPGAFTKNHLYFSGYRAVSAFLQAPATHVERYRSLYAGKIAIVDVPLIQGVLVAPAFMPMRNSDSSF